MTLPVGQRNPFTIRLKCDFEKYNLKKGEMLNVVADKLLLSNEFQVYSKSTRSEPFFIVGTEEVLLDKFELIQ